MAAVATNCVSISESKKDGATFAPRQRWFTSEATRYRAEPRQPGAAGSTMGSSPPASIRSARGVVATSIAFFLTVRHSRAASTSSPTGCATCFYERKQKSLYKNYLIVKLCIVVATHQAFKHKHALGCIQTTHQLRRRIFLLLPLALLERANPICTRRRATALSKKIRLCYITREESNSSYFGRLEHVQAALSKQLLHLLGPKLSQHFPVARTKHVASRQRPQAAQTALFLRTAFAHHRNRRL